MDKVIQPYHIKLVSILCNTVNNDSCSRQVLRFFFRNGKSISIVVAVSGGFYYFIYDTIINPPSNLRHIPRMDLLEFWTALFRNETLDVIAKKYTLPAASRSSIGIYTVCRSYCTVLITKEIVMMDAYHKLALPLLLTHYQFLFNTIIITVTNFFFYLYD